MKSDTLRRFGRSLFVFGASLMFAGTLPARGAEGEWPQWRGPKRDDISTETGLLKDWPEKGPELAWKGTGLGGGFATVSIAGGKIFTMGDQNDGAYIIALDMTGKKLWATKVGQPGGGQGYPGPRCTPTVDGDRVYGLGQYGDLVCVETETGKEVWRTNLETKLGGRMMSGWGYAESPLVDGDHLICAPGGDKGTLAALDKKTGTVVWRSKGLTDAACYASLVPAEIGGAHQYLVLTDASVSGIGTDGSQLWHVTRHGKTAVIPTPVYKDDTVFVTSGYGVGCNAIKVSGSATALKAEQIYANTDMKVHHGGVILLGDHVYGSSDPGILTCMELKSGKVVWKDRSVGKGSLTCADGRLYLRSEGSGEVALVEATPEGYKEHGRLKQPDRSKAAAWPHPVVAGGKLYLRDQDVLLCYDIKAK
ncbi:MAG: bamB 1 [Phycisphaerales bacterium]|nr:bamB 1 [Phycisphaerales bacterium]